MWLVFGLRCVSYKSSLRKHCPWVYERSSDVLDSIPRPDLRSNVLTRVPEVLVRRGLDELDPEDGTGVLARYCGCFVPTSQVGDGVIVGG